MRGNPFPGLRPFKTEETHLFFGREGHINEVLTNLDQNRFIAILGSSGSGKSSLMYCGLIPNLYAGFVGQSGSDWKIVITRPGIDPLENLAKDITTNFVRQDDPNFTIERNINEAILKTSRSGLEEILQKYHRPNQHVLLVIDQFEEIFRYKKKSTGELGDNSDHYIDHFIKAITQAKIAVFLVITMRSDYIGDCAVFPQLTHHINQSHYLVPHMTREDEKQVIRGPLMTLGYSITNALETQLLNSLGSAQDQLPILQHALARTWRYWAAEENFDSPLDIRHYERVGRIKNALSLHANEVYLNLNNEQQYTCQLLFQAITEKEEGGRGIRKPTDMQTIMQITETSFAELAFIIDKFRQPDVGFLMPETHIDLEKTTIIDISHESLMRVWDRCIDWVDQELENKHKYLVLCERTLEHNQGKIGYLEPPELEILWEWYQSYKPTEWWSKRYNPNYRSAKEFLEISKSTYDAKLIAQERQQKAKIRRSRYLFVASTVIAVVLTFISIFAYTSYLESNEQRIKADAAVVEAQEQRALALTEGERAEKERQKAVLKEEEAKRAAQEAQTQRQLALTEKQHAEEERRRAVLKEEEAKQAAQEAQTQRQLALTEKQHAEEEKRKAQTAGRRAELKEQEAKRLRHLSVAKAMAIRSNNLKNKRLKILLAQYAYTLNKSYRGAEFDADIYAALYTANKILDNLPPSVTGHAGLINGLYFSDDKQFIYSIGSDGKILKWNGNNLSLADKLVESNFVFRSMDISQDKRYVMAGTSQSGIRVFDLKERDKEGQVTLVNYPRPITTDQVFKDVFSTNYYANITYGSDTLIYNVHNNNVGYFKNSKKVDRFLRTEDNKFFIVTEDQDILYSERGRPAKKLLSSKNKVTSLAYNSLNDKLIFGTKRGEITIYGIQEGKIERTLEAHEGNVKILQVSPKGEYLASGGFDRRVNIWSIQDYNALPIVIEDHPEWVSSFLFYPDEAKILIGFSDGSLHLYPLIIPKMHSDICSSLSEIPLEAGKLNVLDQNEWNIFAGEDLNLIPICTEFEN